MSDEYSVWLLPDSSGAAYQQVETLISHYVQSYEDAPEFAPHITVVGSVTGDQETLADRVHALADNQQPFEVSFSTVQCSTTRHQCVFVLVTPTVELLSLHQTATETFETSEDMYVPHLSLIYSDVSIEERMEIVGSVDRSALPDTAQLTTLALVNTTGPESAWEPVTTIQL